MVDRQEKVLLAWSSGKDSAWALHELRQKPELEIVGLLTTLNARHDRVAMHAVRRSLVRKQAEAVGLPLWEVDLPHPCDNATYERVMAKVMERARLQGIAAVAFGDLFLDEVRRYRERMLKGTSITPVFPLWGIPTRELVERMIEAGLRARVTCVDPRRVPRSSIGREIDHEWIAELPSDADPCGENGEFHSFAWAGPMFLEPVFVAAGPVVERDGFLFADLIPDDTLAKLGLSERSVASPSRVARALASRRQRELTKPPGSLGRLEEIAVSFAGMRGDVPTAVAPALLVFAGDHGVCAEGVSAYPQAVTAAMLANVLAGGAAVSVLARDQSIPIHVVDVGVIGAQEEPRRAAGVEFTRSAVRAGTRNLAREPALSTTEAMAAIDAGRRAAREAIRAGANLLGVGELGIGNTTAAAALIAVLTGREPEGVVGRGTGVDDAGWARKVSAVRAAVARHAEPVATLELLASLGGLEIAAMAGCMLEAAARRVPTMLDGVVTNAAALVAARCEPRLRAMLFAAHRSTEPAAALALDALGLRPLLELEMRLGEGTGAALGMALVRAGTRVMAEMATFESARVPDRIEPGP